MPGIKFRHKYRIHSIGFPGFDYLRNRAYFITILTAGIEAFFSEISEGKMFLSDIGQIVEINWHEIPQHFPFDIRD